MSEESTITVGEWLALQRLDPGAAASVALRVALAWAVRRRHSGHTEDAASEALVRILRANALQRASPKTRFAGFLAGIARNAERELARRELPRTTTALGHHSAAEYADARTVGWRCQALLGMLAGEEWVLANALLDGESLEEIERRHGIGSGRALQLACSAAGRLASSRAAGRGPRGHGIQAHEPCQESLGFPAGIPSLQGRVAIAGNAGLSRACIKKRLQRVRKKLALSPPPGLRHSMVMDPGAGEASTAIVSFGTPPWGQVDGRADDGIRTKEGESRPSGSRQTEGSDGIARGSCGCKGGAGCACASNWREPDRIRSHVEWARVVAGSGLFVEPDRSVLTAIAFDSLLRDESQGMERKP